MGKDQDVETNAAGAKQSRIPYAFHLIDAHAVLALANVLYEGAKKYGRDNWRGIPVDEHINHAVSHFFAFLAGDDQDDHLEHAFCRAMMALAVDLENQRRIERVLKATDWGRDEARAILGNEERCREVDQELDSILEEIRRKKQETEEPTTQKLMADDPGTCGCRRQRPETPCGHPSGLCDAEPSAIKGDA